MGMDLPESAKKFNEFVRDLQEQLLRSVSQKLEAQLEADVESWLYRGHHQRRKGVKRSSQAYCQRCGTQKASAFSGNGHRKRQLVTKYGVLSFW